MRRDRAKTGVTVVRVSRSGSCKDRQPNPRKTMSVKITPVRRNLSGRTTKIHSVRQDLNNQVDEEQNSSVDKNSTKFTSISQTSLGNPIHLSMTEINETSSAHKINAAHSKFVTSTKGKHQTSSRAPFYNNSFNSFDTRDTSINLSRTNPDVGFKQQSKSKNRRYTNLVIEKRTNTIERGENYRKSRRRQQRKICPAFSNCCCCCCLASAIAALLLLAALAALLIYLFTRKNVTTTTTTTTTSTSVTTSTSTSTTSTTSSTSTSSTTSTSTSTTTSTSVTTSSSTSTSSTSTTSQTTTTTTSVTSTTTTTTTPTPPCVPSSVGSSSLLYFTASSSPTTYQCHAFEWTSPVTGTVTLAFQLRHDPDFWYLDDVSVYAGATQMLSNGDFETGSLSPWARTIPNGNCLGSPGQVDSGSAHSGTYVLRDGSNGCADQVGQQFTATAGQVYVVSFWLKSGMTGSTVSANVTLS